MSWDDDDYDYYYGNRTDYKTIMLISFGICLLICLIVFCCCLFKKRRREGIVRSTAANPQTIAVVYPQNATVVQPHNIQQQIDASGTFYKVPFSALPPNFDYSSSQIEVRADHVILRDLSLLQTLQVASTVTAPSNDYPPSYSSTEAYQKPSPYNPGYGGR